MDPTGPHETELRLHGLVLDRHGRVPAKVFASKLIQFVSALEAADMFANGRRTHTYVIAGLHTSQPSVILREEPLVEGMPNTRSAFVAFGEAVEGIKANDSRIERLAPVVSKISRLTSGAATNFAFAEIQMPQQNVIRIDDFLHKRATKARRASQGTWFNGVAVGAFDGTLKYVDSRGVLPQIKLVLTAGGNEIDCVCRRDDIETLGEALEKRVRVTGRAIYTSTAPMPLRVEVTKIELVKTDVDISKWRGAFNPFEIASWEHDA